MKYLSTYKLFETESKSTLDKMGLLQDLSVDLSDDGLYVKVSTDCPRFKQLSDIAKLKGHQIVFLEIEDKDKVFCKNYPEDDMDWLNNKPIINDFIKRLEDFGMKREISPGCDYVIPKTGDGGYRMYGGGTSVTLVFTGKGYESIKL